MDSGHSLADAGHGDAIFARAFLSRAWLREQPPSLLERLGCRGQALMLQDLLDTLTKAREALGVGCVRCVRHEDVHRLVFILPPVQELVFDELERKFVVEVACVVREGVAHVELDNLLL